MQGANHVSQRINETVSQESSGMGAFISKRKKLFVEAADADLFIFHFRDSDLVRTKVELMGVFGDFMPGKFHDQ
jgi:hypothetical protein